MINGLYRWRDVMSPRTEVARGVFKEGEFSADLVQAVNNKASYEYSNAREFFRRTFLTEGMKRFLAESLRRVSGRDGDPVIQVKTAFGGGKTHSMLAVYHMLRAGRSAAELEGIRDVMRLAGCESVPDVRIAVIGGTDLNPLDFEESGGVKANTLWGNIAAQLGRYEYVRKNDEQGIAPGSSAMRRVFDDGEPCVVLMDELAAYGRKLYQGKNPERGSFGNFQTFVQELTEAAKTSRRSLVIATMPESKLEAGDAEGQRVLEILEHIFGRVESVWKPVEPREGFEVVRRRLFNECGDDSAREMTAEVFSRMYFADTGDFPAYAHEGEYRERLLKCYPIHPEVFDRLYGEWSTLEQFQRTRGVLRLMAKVIHDLWAMNDSSPLIMPCSVNFGSDSVREEIVKYLPEKSAWYSIIDTEIDGAGAVPVRLDAAIDRYGQVQAARRIARVIMLGSAPSAGAQSVRGLERQNILLGTVQPGENISVFTDALGKLRDTLSYLYASETGYRFWFDTRPTLRKTVENRAVQIKAEVVDDEIRRRLQPGKNEPSGFAGVHVWPKDSDVPDTEGVRLVVLRPEHGEAEAKHIVLNHGNVHRKNMNMVVFLGSDSDGVEKLRGKVRLLLAWQSVKDDKASLNLTNAQLREADVNIERCSTEIEELICVAWSVVLVPKIDRKAQIDDVKFEALKVSGAVGTVSERAEHVLRAERKLLDKWDAENMSMELEDLVLDDEECVAVSTLWEWVCRYCYMPKLSGRDVLYSGIREGAEKGMFALADGKAEGKYTGLRMNQDVKVNDSDVIVRRDAAERQLEAENHKPETSTTPGTPRPLIVEPPTAYSTEKQKVMRRFTLSANLKDNPNPQRHVKDIFDEVISQLRDISGGSLKISLEVSCESSAGFSEKVINDVTANCKDIHVSYYNFDE